MMRIAAVGFAAVLFAAPVVPQVVDAAALHPRTLSEGCIASTLSCGITGSGQLAAGDCTFSDGTHYDLWQFSGSAGQLITINLQPLDTSYTLPVLELRSPAGQAPRKLWAAGTPPLSIAYALDSTGTWTVAVETNDLLASGRYSLSLECGTAEVSDPCVNQPLSCNQSHGGWLSPTACQFSDGSRGYEPFLMRLAKGDTLRFSGHSDSFDPTIAMYRMGGNALVWSHGKRSVEDPAFSYTAPEDGSYLFIVSGPNGDAEGEFSMAVSCIDACTVPTVTRQPVSQFVPYGGTASFTVEGSRSNGNLPKYTWIEDGPGLPLTVATGATLTVANVTTPRHFYATVENGCGSTNSKTVTAAPAVPSRGRATRH
jgi:hypothetical protein